MVLDQLDVGELLLRQQQIQFKQFLVQRSIHSMCILLLVLDVVDDEVELVEEVGVDDEGDGLD